MGRKRTPIYGFGINDAKYNVFSFSSGKRACCPFYMKWTGMLNRCYDESFKVKNRTYGKCYVCDEWLIFSNFKKWMELQDWQGKSLDKDMISIGNKVYSPDFCAFINQSTNTFFTERPPSAIGAMVGVTFDKDRNRYLALCRNPISGKKENLGRYKTELEAHKKYLERKSQLATALSFTESDLRIRSALIRLSNYLEIKAGEINK